MSRVLKSSLLLVAVGSTVMIALLIWSYRLDADFSGSSPQTAPDFHKWFWVKFFLGAGLALTGSLVLSVVLPSKTVAIAGLVTLGADALGFFLILHSIDIESWTGASALTLAFIVFCSGAALLLIAGCRVAWTKFRSNV